MVELDNRRGFFYNLNDSMIDHNSHYLTYPLTNTTEIISGKTTENICEKATYALVLRALGNQIDTGSCQTFILHFLVK